MTVNSIQTRGTSKRRWHGDTTQIVYDEASVRACLNRLDAPVFIVNIDGRVGATNSGVEHALGEVALAASALPV